MLPPLPSKLSFCVVDGVSVCVIVCVLSTVEAAVTVMEAGGFFHKEKARIFFLFSDMVLWVSASSFEFKGRAPINTAWVSECPEPSEYQFLLHVTPGVSTILEPMHMVVERADTKRKFLATLQKAVAASHTLR